MLDVGCRMLDVGCSIELNYMLSYPIQSYPIQQKNLRLVLKKRKTAN